MDKPFRCLSLFICALLLAGCVGAPEPVAGTPACKADPPEAPVACTQEYNPVCGCDGMTYPNACTARASGIMETQPGECAPANID